MAENKNSIIVYAEWIKKFEELEDDEAGRLIKHFFRYVNDQDPVAPDRLTKIAFIDIEQCLKRDLAKWDKTKNSRADNGSLGNLKRWHNDLYLKVQNNELSIAQAIEQSKNRKPSHGDNQRDKQSQNVAKIAVNANGNVNGSNNTNSIDRRKLAFSKSLIPFVEKYGKDVIRDFCDYWTEPNKSNTKFRQENETTWSTPLRLSRWAKSDFNKHKTPATKGATDQSQNENLFK
ncbi:DUF6291 domain-containing protein [Pedobacter duraquae]|uniref:DUF6291 domain-containing protein n=1 Tax=Pedobacter duraquae TaxID=425511 RepID=A0A4R6IJ24_9SPHI|nr:DUF6291 domain-containing protein [Pedobacter duraquae]TDO21926.1 hypothetical protein CLV32_3034 [Pedobacter duraquae]